ncbi:unnamed protein product [Cuscuta europaea]|uniref:Uncharacterized protein n=1 Tax=Cuscuta europaea TaxID=41803 RepID=A0A9P0YQ06_CUSEU|nr:unnamed protein product [Cuscuta europaea]
MLWSDDELRENYVCFPPIFCASDEELKPAFPKICLSDEEGRTNASGGELEPLQCSLRTRFATMHESGTLRSV